MTLCAGLGRTRGRKRGRAGGVRSGFRVGLAKSIADHSNGPSGNQSGPWLSTRWLAYTNPYANSHAPRRTPATEGEADWITQRHPGCPSEGLPIVSVDPALSPCRRSARPRNRPARAGRTRRRMPKPDDEQTQLLGSGSPVPASPCAPPQVRGHAAGMGLGCRLRARAREPMVAATDTTCSSSSTTVQYRVPDGKVTGKARISTPPTP